MGEAILVGGRMGAVEQVIYKWKQYQAVGTNTYYWNRYNVVSTTTYKWNKWNAVSTTMYRWDKWNAVTTSGYKVERWTYTAWKDDPSSGWAGMHRSNDYYIGNGYTENNSAGYFTLTGYSSVNGRTLDQNLGSYVGKYMIGGMKYSPLSSWPSSNNDGGYGANCGNVVCYITGRDSDPGVYDFGFRISNHTSYKYTMKSLVDYITVPTTLTGWGNFLGGDGYLWKPTSESSTTVSKGSTSYGTVSSASSSAYPNGGASGSYWYDGRTSYIEQSKGSTSYGQVSSTSSSAYPSNGVSGSYWYESAGSTTSYSKGSTKYSDVSSTNSSAYPDNGKSGSYWYVYSRYTTTWSQGDYIADRLSTDRDRWPDNGRDGDYWYVFDGEA